MVEHIELSDIPEFCLEKMVESTIWRRGRQQTLGAD